MGLPGVGVAAAPAVAPEVAEALAQGRPVVAVESALIAPAGRYPQNVDLYREVEKAIVGAGATPALVAVVGGRIAVGLDAAQLQELAGAKAPLKAARRDLGLAVARKATATTTVSSTMHCARLCGIRVMMTGAIGGVHRGHESTLDVSADLTELAGTPVAVVCVGAKVILDLPRTLECLETLSVPVVGFGTGTFPAYFGSTDLPVEQLDTAEAIAAMLAAHWSLDAGTGAVVAIAPPVEIPRDRLEALVAEALARAQREGVSGKAITPFLMRQLDAATAGQSEEIRRRAIVEVAAAAAEVARALAAISGEARQGAAAAGSRG